MRVWGCPKMYPALGVGLHRHGRSIFVTILLFTPISAAFYSATAILKLHILLLTPSFTPPQSPHTTSTAFRSLSLN